MNKLRVIEAFGGIGAWAKALKNLGINHEVLEVIEFDGKTMDCYNAIHGSSFTASDITKIDASSIPDCDVFCYSPPCQSYSIAVKGEGINDHRGTLFYDALRIIEAKKPKYLLMENVKNLTQKAHRYTFDAMLKSLEDAGYTNHWKVLNAKDHGAPQGRERVFVISIRNDIEDGFGFPVSYDGGARLRNVIEPVVDEKYYIDDAKCSELLEELRGKEMPSVNEINVVGRLSCINGHDLLKRVYSIDGIAPTLDACTGGNRQPKIFVDSRIRKLTTLEFFRLQSFSDEDHRKLVDVGMANTQIYKVAGNSINVKVVEELFKALLCPTTIHYETQN